ncbi:thermonuclease [Thomasclavelia cocleata]|uniref:Thermonuclease n=1 Tax=Thomasclavelia cocleata TaxID=69824 RepID=A0A829ZCW6_9FIRM|nr:thermonuclease family protein [Thomasclavelia cocleata]GFI41896.1 thermonuclease [Thomasclavelia cocleata]
MSKQIKLRKKDYRKLLHSWIGILVVIGVLGYNYYQSNKSIEPGKRFEVTLNKCVDGDTAWFDINGEKTKVRFLYIDTPESTKEIEPYGKEASEYTKEQLSNASKIELELNVDGNTTDKYDRLLAWVFVDGELLQEKLASKGLVEKFYDYGYDYTYKSEIIEADKRAKNKRCGIYS